MEIIRKKPPEKKNARGPPNFPCKWTWKRAHRRPEIRFFRQKWKFESARGYAPLAPRVPVDMPEGTRSLLKPDKWGDFLFAVIIL